jgi:hypothetical protein
MPHGFTWGLVLLKDLPKPPIPFGIFMPKSKMEKWTIITTILQIMKITGFKQI